MKSLRDWFKPALDSTSSETPVIDSETVGAPVTAASLGRPTGRVYGGPPGGMWIGGRPELMPCPHHESGACGQDHVQIAGRWFDYVREHPFGVEFAKPDGSTYLDERGARYQGLEQR
jgi:hypothetical protein